MNPGRRLPYIVIEGPIGVGKTSLATRLAGSLKADLLLEQPEANPFLDAFYADRPGSAMAAQLSFLLQRVAQLQTLDSLQQGVRPLIADFMFAKDRLFAELNLEDKALSLYRQLAAQLHFDTPHPDLVIYLHAPVRVLVQRIEKRGRTCEVGLDPVYLYRLNRVYDDYFGRYQGAPLLRLDTRNLDLVNGAAEYQHLLQQIKSKTV